MKQLQHIIKRFHKKLAQEHGHRRLLPFTVKKYYQGIEEALKHQNLPFRDENILSGRKRILNSEVKKCINYCLIQIWMVSDVVF